MATLQHVNAGLAATALATVVVVVFPFSTCHGDGELDYDCRVMSGATESARCPVASTAAAAAAATSVCSSDWRAHAYTHMSAWAQTSACARVLTSQYRQSSAFSFRQAPATGTQHSAHGHIVRMRLRRTFQGFTNIRTPARIWEGRGKGGLGFDANPKLVHS